VSRMSIVQDAPKTQQVPKTLIVNHVLIEDRRQTIRHIAETTDIHATTVYRIVSGDLGMKRVSAHWVPIMLTDEQKQNPVDVCTDVLCRLQA